MGRKHKRASVQKKLRADDIRRRICNGKLLEHIERDLEKIAEMAAEIPADDEGSYSIANHRKVMAALNATKIRLNARFRLLNKVVPDAKDTDIDSPNEDPPKLTLRIVR
jgi:hypothetical protein